MPIGLYGSPAHRQWRILFVYNIYRLISIGLLLIFYVYHFESIIYSELFFGLLTPYVVFAALCFYLGHKKFLRFETQVFIAGTVDVIAMSSMLIIIGNLYLGFGMLLNITIACLSILIPGRIAVFFAALASCFLLYGIFMSFLEGHQKDTVVFFYSGVYGAGFFATALTALYLASRVRVSERLAIQRSEELAAMQRINEYIVGRLHSGIIYVDEERQIKLINSAVRKFFNIKKKEAPKTLDDLSWLLADKFNYFLTKTIHNEGMAQTFLEEPYLRVHFFSTEVVKNPAVLIILEDMTYIAQQAQQLKLASLGRFSASIAHELRNPLGAISHAVQLFGDEGELNQEDKRLKQLIIKNCERMNGVIKNVLQLSRRQQSQPQIIDIASFLLKFKEDFCHNNSCHCKMVIKVPKNLPFLVVFDKSQLEQVLVILCDNALQHGRDEKGLVKIVIAVRSAFYKTIITVSDMGPGVPAEYRDSIFEPFFTTIRTGTGMGLFIARDLCEINQARLNWVKSNKGSGFAITINPSDELLI